MPIPRVAVIAVHGVADQQPGDTARAVVELLVSSAPAKTCYTSAATADLTLRVPPLQPQAESVPDEEIESTATPSGEDRGPMKSLRQSLRSDFQRHAWASKAPPHAAKASAIGAPPTGEDRGIAVTNYLLTKHIRNGARPETYDTACVTLRRHEIDPDELDAAANTQTAELDVYEMYWADLSRLSGSVPRIVSELFTLVFRLSKLGRETVDEMWGQLARARKPDAPRRRLHASAWNVVAWLQIGLDWMFVNGLALLFTQLALLGILLVCLGFTSGIAPEVARNVAEADAARLHQRWLHGGVAIAVIVVAVLRLLYRRGDGKMSQAVLALATIAGVLVAFALGEERLQWVTAIALLAALTLANEFLLRVADDRFPLVHVMGRWMWAAFALMMVANAMHETPDAGIPPWREIWVHAALFTTETVLLVIKWWWIVAGPLLVVWFLAGQFARGESGYASRASIATGRLGITVSLGMFLAVTMTIWALVNNVLSESVDGVRYQPCVFAYSPASAPSAAIPAPPAAIGGVNACIWTSRNASLAAATAPVPSASAVLFDRYANSTSAFSVLATLLLTLVAYLLVMFTPSVLAELKLIVESRRNAHKQVLVERRAEKEQPARAAAQAVEWQKRMDDGEQPDLAEPPKDDPAEAAAVDDRAQNARELGRWLTFGYRHLDFVVAVISFAGIVLGIGITALFLATVFERQRVTELLAAVHLKGLMDWIASFKDQASGATRTLFNPLQALVFSAAGVGATLSLLGGQLSRRLPSLRGPLDIALDVDNHFREFPRTNIPRAQIFSRYAALLEHLRTQGYERIVVVSHSQGTVISSELLRFLSSREKQAPKEGQAPHLRGNPLPPMSLLTLGSPLRQLYGARFPGLYAWVLAKNGSMFGPRAADIGVQRWMNAFCSGDYVGRWLWSDASKTDELVHPMVNTLAEGTFGRADAYTGFSPMPPLDDQLNPASEVEVCLGLGAHTHYFERDQTTVAWMIDYLVRAPLAGQPGAPEYGPGPVPTVDAQAGQPAKIVDVEASVVSDGSAAPAAAPDTTAPPPPTTPS